MFQTEGTLKPSRNFNAESDANILRKAMKGFGEYTCSEIDYTWQFLKICFWKIVILLCLKIIYWTYMVTMILYYGFSN